MLRQAVKKSLALFLILPFFLTNSVEGKVIEQLIAVIDGEPYTITNVGVYAKI